MVYKLRLLVSYRIASSPSPSFLVQVEFQSKQLRGGSAVRRRKKASGSRSACDIVGRRSSNKTIQTTDSSCDYILCFQQPQVKVNSRKKDKVAFILDCAGEERGKEKLGRLSWE